jgi:hypothetical protein
MDKDELRQQVTNFPTSEANFLQLALHMMVGFNAFLYSIKSRDFGHP